MGDFLLSTGRTRGNHWHPTPRSRMLSPPGSVYGRFGPYEAAPSTFDRYTLFQNGHQTISFIKRQRQMVGMGYGKLRVSQDSSDSLPLSPPGQLSGDALK